MIQDIFPHVLNNAFVDKKPLNGDYLFCFYNNQLVLKEEDEGIILPIYESSYYQQKMDYIYLFSLDHISCFLCIAKKTKDEKPFLADTNYLVRQSGYHVYEIKQLKKILSQELYFISTVAEQVYRWLKSNHYCGCCRGIMQPSGKERALICKECGNIIFPNIPPAVIVAITNEDRILLAKGKHYGGSFYSLIAGYAEIGETLEQAVIREVKEETQLKVKNITYYTNQPWPTSGALMIGFTAELDGNDQIQLDEEELEEAKWFSRDNVPLRNSDYSIAACMIKAFKNGEF